VGVTFQRARTDEQRDERRRTILDVTAAMLNEMPVADVSLNELSRRVGLAKSNVLRYFDSREAILLELLDAELREWVDELDDLHTRGRASARARSDRVALRLATSMAERPIMCDLINAQAAVLERNVSTEVALRHKQASRTTVQSLIDAITNAMPELSTSDAYELIATTLLLAAGAWPHGRPSESVLAAYSADASLAAGQLNFAGFMQRAIGVTIEGLIASQTPRSRR
jgi:AcrR family transcriptional regulator